MSASLISKMEIQLTLREMRLVKPKLENYKYTQFYKSWAKQSRITPVKSIAYQAFNKFLKQSLEMKFVFFLSIFAICGLQIISAGKTFTQRKL